MSGCAIVELNPKALDVIALPKFLAQLGRTVPVIFIGSRIGVPIAVQAMKSGAVSVLTKPVAPDELANAIHDCIGISEKWQDIAKRHVALSDRLESLNTREREVMMLMVNGLPTKAIAKELGVCQRTAAQIRSHVYRKMGAESVVDLAVMVGDLWKYGHREQLYAEPVCPDAWSSASRACPTDASQDCGEHSLPRSRMVSTACQSRTH
jgi:two-component system response regulator FixJ